MQDVSTEIILAKYTLKISKRQPKIKKKKEWKESLLLSFFYTIYFILLHVN